MITAQAKFVRVKRQNEMQSLEELFEALDVFIIP
jgi:hypothetical protein